MPDDKELNERQKAFVDEYLIDMNGARAARAAGYKESNARQQAYRNRATKAYIKSELDKRLTERSKRADGSFEWMEEKLINAAERCSSEDDFNPNGLVQTVGLLAKLKGLMTDKVQLNAKVDSTHNIEMIKVIESDSHSLEALRLMMRRTPEAAPMVLDQ